LGLLTARTFFLTGKGSLAWYYFSDSLFFKGNILSDLFLRGIEKTLKSSFGRVRNYPSFLLF
jgi:hypothetical protein